MIPGNSLSSTYLPAEFLYPDSRLPRQTKSSLDTSLAGQCLTDAPQDWEMGGIGLQDPSRGSMYQAWQFRYLGGVIEVGPDPSGPWTTILGPPTLVNVTEISGAFDANMNVAVAFVDSGVTKLWWYDSSLPGMTLTTFAGCSSPRLTLDDKRETQTSIADILFFYLRADSLYYRQQRDRYEVERLLCAAPPNTLRLGRTGMSTGNRVQIEFLTGG